MEEEAHAGVSLLTGLVNQQGICAGTVCTGRTEPCEIIHAGAGSEELQPAGRTHIGVHGELSYYMGETGVKCVRSPPPQVDGAAEAMCDELNTIPIPHLPALIWGKEVEKNGGKVKPGKKEGTGRRCL